MIRIAKIIRDVERAIGRRFTGVSESIRNGARISELENLIDQGDQDAILRYLQIDRVAWQPMAEAIRDAYRTGGDYGAGQLGNIRTDDGLFSARFDIDNPRAERWLMENSSERVVEIVDDQRNMLRSVLASGVESGRNPREIALDMLGRVNPRTKAREGGFIGLTESQAKWILNARAELESLDRGYFDRALRDVRFDAAIRQAMESGKPISKDIINAAINQMQRRAENYRAETIARTESLNSLRAGQWEAIEQAVEDLEVPSAETVKIWSSSGDDGRTREDHLEMEGERVAVGEPFTLPDGSQLMYPGDSSLGAPPEQVIQCRCSVRYEIDFGEVARKIEGF